MENTIWVLNIDHKHGNIVSVHETEAGAKAHLADYVRLWWEDVEDEAGPMPENAREAIEAYFEHNDAEFYYLTQEPLGE